MAEEKKNKKKNNISERFKESDALERAKIKSEPNKFKRFWRWILYFLIFPFKWLFTNVRDWRTAVCLAIAFLITSASVWLFYLIAIILGVNTDAAKWFWGIGSTVWLWWLSPAGSPFILITISLGIGIKGLFDLIKRR